MNEALEALIKAARKIEPSAEDRERQRRSFAYGNTRFENSLITREMIDEQAERLKRSAEGSHD
jgi:hypothetical protein